MYIKTGSTQYPITGASFGTQLTWSGVDGLTNPPSGIVETYRDDGFLLRSDNGGDWAHIWLEDNALTFSQAPKPQPVPPEPPQPDPATLDEVVGGMVELGALVSDAYDAIAELGEIIGGQNG